MSVIQFDSLEYAQELQKSGLSREQAEGIARVNTRAFQTILDSREIATKQDIMRLEQVSAQNRHELEILIHTVKNDILRWVIGLLLAQSALFFSALAFFR